MALDLRLEAPPGLEISAPAVRVPDEHEVVWRIKALAEGSGRLILRAGDRTFGKSVAVGGRKLDQGLGHRVARVVPEARPLSG